MKEYNISKSLELIDKSKTKSFIYKYLLAPYKFFLEYYCRQKIWVKFIYHTMLTSDDIVNALDKEDFALLKNKTFVKKELLNDPEKSEEENKYNFKDLKKAKELIFGDYSQFFLSVLKKNFQFDVENYVNMTVVLDVDTTQDHGEVYHETTYTVTLRWWREFDYIKSRTSFIIWLLIVGLIIATILIIHVL